VKSEGELTGNNVLKVICRSDFDPVFSKMLEERIITGYNSEPMDQGIPVIVVSVDNSDRKEKTSTIGDRIKAEWKPGMACLVLVVDHNADVRNLFMVAWQMLGNSDPQRDNRLINGSVLIIDGTIKFYRPGGFPRKWPNVVTASAETISSVDNKWEKSGLGAVIPSPSLIYRGLLQPGTDELK
jgi:3-polyprenyl-4-hydroxybenzoate decarboxylase